MEKLLIAAGIGFIVWYIQTHHLLGGTAGSGPSSGSGSGGGAGTGSGAGSGAGTGTNHPPTTPPVITHPTVVIQPYTVPTIPVQQITYQPAQVTEAHNQGFNSVDDLNRFNSAMRRNLIPADSTPVYFYEWLSGQHINDATILSALSGDPLAQTVVQAGNLMLGWDYWNNYYKTQTGVDFPPAFMDTVPGDRWGQVNLVTYLSWAIPASQVVSGLSGLGMANNWYWV